MATVKRNEKLPLYGGKIVTVSEQGHIVELTASTHVKASPVLKKLSAEEYVDTRTGEVKQYIHTENRAERYKDLKSSMKKLRDIVNCNTTDATRVLWATFTYAENMTDSKRLYSDFKRFNTRFRRYLAKESLPLYEYICVAEPQERGAWHIHVIFIFSARAPFVPVSKLTEFWSQGYVFVRFSDNVDNLGAYLSAYLSDIPCDVNTSEYSSFNILEKQGKKYIKGGRLSLYPPGFNYYRCSRGVKRPVVYETTLEEAHRSLAGSTLTYEYEADVIDNKTGNALFSYRKEFYNKKRDIKKND